MKYLLTVLLALVLGLIVAGIAWVFPPAGLIAAGVALALLLTFDPDRASEMTWPR